MKTGSVQFGDFVLDTAEKTLTRRGADVPLPPKALKLLLALVENRGHILEKDELIEKVWADTFVEEGNLPYTIRLLRRTLGDDADAPKYIETMPRRGYRFVAKCRPVSGRTASPRTSDDGYVFGQSVNVAGGLIGREKELEEITERLSRDNLRFLTLTGTGGTGKTRLAREIAGQVDYEFPDGVFFVDLTAVSDPQLVASSIAFQVGLKKMGKTSARELLGQHFRNSRTLLIVDNFEQVVSASVDLVELIRDTSGLKLLVTSREPLKVSIETEYRVPPLDRPTQGTRETISNVLRFGAAKLFVERARAARPDLELSDADADSVIGICNMLDGLPLALELAASRAKVLSLQQIFSKLEDRLALLTGGSRDVPDRQRTMRSTIEWSFSLLAESEKIVFASLSVFEGGFTFEAAEKVLTAGETRAFSGTEIVDAIASLTEKGLLLSEKSPDGGLRFKMLVVVRDYALELRSQAEDSEAVRRAHAEYFLEFAEKAVPYLFSFQSPEWLDRFELERDNIRASIRWSLDNDLQIAARILAAVRFLAALRLHTNETRYWLEEALKTSGDLTEQLRSELLTGLGIVCQYQLDLPAARRIHEECLELSRRISDKRLIARALRGIGAIDYIESDLAEARDNLAEALSISRSINDEFGEAAALARLGDIANAGLDHPGARELMLESLAIFKRLRYKQGIASKLANLSITEFFLGDHAAAQALLIEGLKTAIDIDDRIEFRLFFEVAAALMVVAKNYDTAARLSGSALALCEEMAYFHEPVEQRFRETYLAELQSAMRETDFAAAFADGRKMKVNEAVKMALEAARDNSMTQKHLHLVRGRTGRDFV